MSKAKWIWYQGDFETYHHLILSCRRQEKGCDYPCMWHLSSPEKSVCFFKKFDVPTDTTIKIVTHSTGMVRLPDGLHRVNEDIPLKAGKYDMIVELFDLEKFPSMFLDSEYLVSDESWICDSHDKVDVPVGCEPCFYNENDDPSVFPFEYEELTPVNIEKINGGVLYDFGKESFGPIELLCDNPDGISLTYGESREEALDFNNAILREILTKNDSPVRPARAFRFIFIKRETEVKLIAKYEYLPLEDKAYFECEDDEIKKIWDTCAYTFHLNSREFFLDGIKRDRWVWSGDAYQSFMINRCLFNDNAITERTIKALLGKPPYRSHINGINDYSAYLIFSAWEHFSHSGNRKFLEEVYPNIKELYGFIVSRLDENGYVVQRGKDWIFIDWGELDKDGANCCEQILLWNVYNVMGKLASAAGEENCCSQKADALKEKINNDFWNEEKGAFIDSFSSGRNFVTKQTNVMAVLYDFADRNQKKKIIKNVFENDTLPQIKTPYFKLFELLALCKCDKIELAQNYISSYWGEMLKLGATSIWEEFNPEKCGVDHYEMYGEPYGKSLCHAWGSGPILLLINQCAGIDFNTDGFTVRPNPGKYKKFSACAPVGDGYVKVNYDNGSINILTNVDGGRLIFGGREYKIIPNEILKK